MVASKVSLRALLQAVKPPLQKECIDLIVKYAIDRVVVASSARVSLNRLEQIRLIAVECAHTHLELHALQLAFKQTLEAQNTVNKPLPTLYDDANQEPDENGCIQVILAKDPTFTTFSPAARTRIEAVLKVDAFISEHADDVRLRKHPKVLEIAREIGLEKMSGCPFNLRVVDVPAALSPWLVLKQVNDGHMVDNEPRGHEELTLDWLKLTKYLIYEGASASLGSAIDQMETMTFSVDNE